MFKNSIGKTITQDECIFSLIAYYPTKKTFKCRGTGFFINPIGGFVTAKHVFFENDGSHVPTLYGVQSIFYNGKREVLIRPVIHFVPHMNADIALGFLGKPKDNKKYANTPPLVSPFAISLSELKENDEVRTNAFPSTKSIDISDDEQLFTFKGIWSTGKIVEFCPDGGPLVKNPCYHTTMNILDGASGGPVLKDNIVVAINSSAYEIGEGEPISYVTPISLIQDLSIRDGEKIISVRDLIKNNFIKSV